MPRLLALPLALPLAVAAFVGGLGCNQSDPEALYIDALYQMRCLDCEPRSNDGPVRDIHHLDGDQGFDLGCDLSPASGDGTLVSFYARYVDPENDAKNFSFEVSRAGLDGADPGATCAVKVLDNGTTYEGNCVATDDMPEPPCTVSLAKDGDVIRGSVMCERIPVQDMREPIRYLYKPNSKKAAPIEIRGCGG